jgi:hypothetical protein
MLYYWSKGIQEEEFKRAFLITPREKEKIKIIL